ncbi:hypothetical protein [Mycobacterium sp. SMC-4]|nr:hypothetical protein [Mycobacterium sp. SMC-4]UXA19827.1 hypothetical protein KXD98_09675 [Mycobacterium sp. SMC-4]
MSRHLTDAEREAIRRHVADAPPLTEAQITRIRLLLMGVTPEDTDYE